VRIPLHRCRHDYSTHNAHCATLALKYCDQLWVFLICSNKKSHAKYSRKPSLKVALTTLAQRVLHKTKICQIRTWLQSQKIFSCDHEHWPMTLTLDGYRVNVNRQAKYLGQRSFRSKVAVQTHTPTQPIAVPGSLQETQLSLKDRATRACQLKSGKVLHKCRWLVFEKLWN